MAIATARPIYEIAADIQRAWGKVNFAAAPYLDAMLALDKPSDQYGCDDASTIVLYFLGNAAGFRGDDAKRLKGELRGLLR